MRALVRTVAASTATLAIVICPVGSASAGRSVGKPVKRAAHGHRPSKGRRSLRTSSWAAATHFARPHFRPTRRIVVRNAESFQRAWRGIRPGEEIEVRGVTFKGQVALVNKRLAGWAEVHFDRRTKFVGYPRAENMAAVYLTNDSYIRFYGGDISDSASGGMAGTGITLHDSSHLLWWNFDVHDVGGEGVYVAGVYKQSSYLDLKLDPHPEKGTGMHAINVGDSYRGVTHSRLAIYAHDGAAGSAMSIGGGRSTDGAEYNTIYMRCRNLSMRATIQVAGNCIQFWGENDIGNVVEYLQARNLAGRPYDANGLYPGQSLSTDVVEYGRASDTNRNPYLARTEWKIPAGMQWDRRGGTVFKNVAGTR
jgi:hypothetical protein